MKLLVEVDTDTPQGRRLLDLLLGSSIAAQQPQQPAAQPPQQPAAQLPPQTSFSVQQPGTHQPPPGGGPAWPAVQATMPWQQPQQPQQPPQQPADPSEAMREPVTPGPSPTDDLTALQNQLNDSFGKFYNSNVEKARELANQLRDEYGIDSKAWTREQLQLAITKVEGELTL